MHIFSEPAEMMRIVVAALCASMALIVSAEELVEENEITREAVVVEINRQRIEYGLEPLQADDRLHFAAEDRIRDMESLGYWAHESPEGTSPFVWLEKRSYIHRIAGENLASGLETARILVESWMESPGHRANILSPEFEDIGVAWIEGGTTHRLTGRSVVVIFAREMEEQPES